MVKLLDLKQSKAKQVRAIIKNNDGVIKVFEPTVEDMEEVLRIQTEDGIVGEESVEFSAVTVLRKLFPLFTDIEGFEELTDEELNDIVDNPTVALIHVQNEVSQIIAETNELHIAKIKTTLKQTSAIVEQAKLLDEIPSLMAKEAKRTGNTAVKEGLNVVVDNSKVE